MSETTSARTLFPSGADLDVVWAFLCGEPRDQTGDALSYEHAARTLTYGTFTLAWVSPSDRALHGKLATGALTQPSLRVMHVILDMLGSPERRFEREVPPHEPLADGDNPPTTMRPMRWFFDGTPTALDRPVVLAGPLTLQAYQVAAEHKPV